jgi:electron transfer flavoprotein beta subunit
MLAAKLGLPYATNAVGLEIDGDALIVRRQGDAGQEIIELPQPGLVTCSNDMNEPRIPTLKGIMGSKRKPAETIELSSMDLNESDLAAQTTVTGYREKPKRKAGQKFEGEPEEIAEKVVKLLDEEAGVI